MATIGMGSTLVYRAREAAMRAKTADILGTTRPSQALRGVTALSAPAAIPGVMNAGAQPPMPGSVDTPIDERMYADVETFLAGLKPKVP